MGTFMVRCIYDVVEELRTKIPHYMGFDDLNALSLRDTPLKEGNQDLPQPLFIKRRFNRMFGDDIHINNKEVVQNDIFIL